VIEALKNVGLGTAKSVLNASEEMIAQADLEEDTVNRVKDILLAEFED
jgi:N utilization substance protein A